MTQLDPFARFTYLGMEAVIIGSVLLFVVAFHFPILRRQWRALLITFAFPSWLWLNNDDMFSGVRE